MIEPVLEPEPNTYVFALQPRFPELHAQFEAARAVDWKPHDVKFAQDLVSFRAMPPATQRMIKRVMALFGIADGLIQAGLLNHFLVHVKCQAAQSFYVMQASIELTHAEVYARMLQAYIEDAAEREELLHAVAHYPVIAEKQAWILKWCQPGAVPFNELVVAFAAVECVFFSPSFAAFGFFKAQGTLPGLCFANTYIARDEGMHVRFACTLHGLLNDKVPAERIRDIVLEAADIELRFADFLLRGDGWFAQHNQRGLTRSVRRRDHCPAAPRRGHARVRQGLRQHPVRHARRAAAVPGGRQPAGVHGRAQRPGKGQLLRKGQRRLRDQQAPRRRRRRGH